jgi:hypothetical protein
MNWSRVRVFLWRARVAEQETASLYVADPTMMGMAQWFSDHHVVRLTGICS